MDWPEIPTTSPGEAFNNLATSCPNITSPFSGKAPLTRHQGLRILEDSKGTYWIGTWTAGLYHIRINADYSYEIIKTIDQLSSSIIYSLYEDPSGQIWSGTHTGLYILSEAHSSEPGIQTYFAGKDASQLSNNSIMDIIEDRSGVIWLAIQGGGVHKIDPSVNRFSTIKLPPGEEPLQSAAIRSFYSSDPSTLLVGLNGLGLGQYLLNTGAFIPYQQLPEFRNLPEITQWNGAVCLHKDHRGNFWIGTRYYGVYVIDGESYTCKN